MRWFRKEQPENTEWATSVSSLDERLRVSHLKELSARQLAITECIEGIPKNWQLVNDQHARDVETYTIKALRHGDFLSVMMGRYIGEEFEKFTILINLGITTKITTKFGRSPSLDGETFFSAYTNNKGNVSIRERSSFKTHHFKSFCLPDSGMHSFTRMRDDKDSEIISGTPVSALDDIIVFEGSNTSLTVPHGLLDACKKIIERAIAKGYQFKALPKTSA